MKTAPATEHQTKHLVRAYLERRAREQKPPPSLEEIRRQLGWHGLERHQRVAT
jgi:aminoglycoside/choline kinase family phosphotransferase